ncbi:hypothetical protein Z043_107049 [Scleropages formosus]|uniref:DNA primase large subunit n=1 Tax=Scleropages formosus TaxID=113540 RepID=A0A0P7UYQ3_SCLFO|nr:hypothetical protein Z043_107049 [Scleropages formosus]
MLFGGRKKKGVENPQTELYGHCLQLYTQPPLENISLVEFEQFAVDRMKLLKTVENLGVTHIKTSEDYSKKLHAEISSLNFPHRTEVSTFIVPVLKEDLRRWFIQQEMDLFRHRFNDLSPKSKSDFLHRNSLQYETISVEEKKSLMEKLINSSYAFSGCTVEEQDFYKVPFQDALDLVRMRKVFVKDGFAYVPHQDIVTIVLNDYRTRLSKALAVSHCFIFAAVPDGGGCTFAKPPLPSSGDAGLGEMNAADDDDDDGGRANEILDITDNNVLWRGSDESFLPWPEIKKATLVWEASEGY